MRLSETSFFGLSSVELSSRDVRSGVEGRSLEVSRCGDSQPFESRNRVSKLEGDLSGSKEELAKF
jgi:hypothetical protein